MSNINKNAKGIKRRKAMSTDIWRYVDPQKVKQRIAKITDKLEEAIRKHGS